MFDLAFVVRRADYALFRIALRSVQLYLEGAGEVLAVVPDAEAGFFRSLELGARIVPEGSLHPALAGAPGGWFKQMLIKLLLGPALRSEAALVFDADVMVARPVAASWFYAPGQPPPFYVERPDGGVHPRWHAASSAALGGEPGPSFFPTPNFVHRQVLEDLHARLGERYGGSGPQALRALQGQYTEWALYGHHLRSYGGAGPQRLRPVDHVRGVWDREDLERWEPEAAPDAPLLVLQSLLPLPLPRRRALLSRHPHLSAALDYGPARAWCAPAGVTVEVFPRAAEPVRGRGQAVTLPRDQAIFPDQLYSSSADARSYDLRLGGRPVRLLVAVRDLEPV